MHTQTHAHTVHTCSNKAVNNDALLLGSKANQTNFRSTLLVAGKRLPPSETHSARLFAAGLFIRSAWPIQQRILSHAQAK